MRGWGRGQVSMLAPVLPLLSIQMRWGRAPADMEQWEMNRAVRSRKSDWTNRPFYYIMAKSCNVRCPLRYPTLQDRGINSRALSC